jgi:hypothetical protein
MEGSATSDDALLRFRQCASADPHPEGDLDPRIVAFYQRLTSRFPDHPPPYDVDTSPWMVMPLSTGIDHVIMYISYGSRGTDVVRAVMELAKHHGLVLVDPQSDGVYLPSG